jgi:hypothetical protein
MTPMTNTAAIAGENKRYIVPPSPKSGYVTEIDLLTRRDGRFSSTEADGCVTATGRPKTLTKLLRELIYGEELLPFRSIQSRTKAGLGALESLQYR